MQVFHLIVTELWIKLYSQIKIQIKTLIFYVSYIHSEGQCPLDSFIYPKSIFFIYMTLPNLTLDRYLFNTQCEYTLSK